MKRFGHGGLSVLILFLVLLAPACAARKGTSCWRPGDPIICPHCAREFPVPEKLGP